MSCCETSIWDIPNIWNTALSGFLVVVLPAFLRLTFFRPKLHLSFEKDMAPGNSFADLHGEGTRIRQSFYSQLQVRNIGKVSLDEPRVWCISIKIKEAENKLKDYPLTPFELDWTDTDKDYQIGAVFPGNYGYKINLLQLDVESSSNTSTRDFFVTMPRRDKNNLRPIQLLEGAEHYLCIIISNTNLLVPAHFAHLRLKWVQDSGEYSGVKFEIDVINQKDFFQARSVGETQLFEVS